MASSPVYAIDFGTSNSLLGIADQTGAQEFVPLDPGASDPRILRSVLYFPNESCVFYGSEAVREFAAHDHDGRFIRSIKRQLPSRQFVGTYVGNRPLNLEDLIGLFLAELRKRANEKHQVDVTRVVLGRPARFSADDTEDRFAEGRLESAARKAGFKEIEFFPEPIAAALGHATGARETKKEEIVLAADFGGGTSDFTVYRLGHREFSPSDVLALGGLALAGDALDAALMRNRISPYFGTGVRYQVPFGSNVLTMPPSLMERICHPAEISLLRKQDTLEFFRNVRQWSLGPEDRERMDRLFVLLEDQQGFPVFEAIERTKRELSRAAQATFEFSYPGIDLREKVTRAQFEKYAETPLTAIIASLDEILKQAQIPTAKIDRVLCTGGTARVPWLRAELARRFGETKLFELDPFTGVASGLMARAVELARA